MPKQRIRIREVADGVDGAPPWITTYVDMVSLLVTFFILLYTFSSIKTYDTFTYPKNIIASTGIFPGESADTIEAPADDLMLAMDLKRGSRKRHTRPVHELRRHIGELGQKLDAEHVPIDLRATGDGIAIEFSERAGFRPGDASATPALQKALLELADTIQYYPLMVVVEGHTDDAFVPTPTHPDADAMSIARARAAAAVLTEEGGFDPSLVLLEGHGARRPRNPSAASARERVANRRVRVRLVSMSKDRIAAASQEGGR